MDLGKIYHLIALGGNVLDTELVSGQELGLRLNAILMMLFSAHKKVQKMGGLGSLDKMVERRVKYGLSRMEFYVNEIKLSEFEGRNRKRYLAKLAKDVLQDVPLLTDAVRQGSSLTKELEIKIDRVREINVIVDLLLSGDSRKPEPVSVVPVLGVAGTGKTSLVHLVYYDQRVKRHFDERRWVGISEFDNQGEILQELEKELDDKKWLLVFGDLPHDQDFEELIDLLRPFLSVFEKNKRGSKILVTSRSTYVERSHYLSRLPIAKDAPFLLKPLSLAQSLLYAQNMACRASREIVEQDRNPLLINIGYGIVNKCAKNLHAITIIASILSSESANQEKWPYFNDTLLAGVENPVKYIRSSVDLMLKHNNTPTDTHLLLAYSSLFPLNYNFNKLELQQLWEVQGLLHHVAQVKKFDVLFEELLLKEYFFTNNKRDRTGVMIWYNIQPLMYEVVKHLASHNYRLLDQPAKEVDAQHVSFIVDSSWEAPFWLYDAKVLKSLLFFPSKSCRFVNIHNIYNILANLKSLQALDQALDLAIVHCRSHPDSIGELKHLRYLRLGISFESLPECITNLMYLSTLDLRHTAIQELPKSFHKLRNLRHLYTGGRLIDLPPRFGELTKLQTLDVFMVGQNNGLDALAKLLCLAGKLKICYQRNRDNHVYPDYSFADTDLKILSKMKLDDLSFVWSSLNGDPENDTEQEKDVMELEFFQPPSTLRCLVVHGWKGVRFPQWVMNQFSVLYKNLVFIYIVDCHRCQHLPSFNSLPSLDSLQLRGLDALEWIEVSENTSKPGSYATKYFQSLTYLTLVNLPQLKGWYKVEEHDADFQQQKHEKQQYLRPKIFNRLSELRVSGCPNLMSIPLVPSLELLVAVDIHDKLLKNLLSTQGSNSSASTTLKELHIKTVHGLQSLLIAITSLQVLTVRECQELSNVLVDSSNSIKLLKLRACPRLKDISRAVQHLSVLEELEIENCEGLDWVDMTDQVGENGDDSVGAAWQGLKNLRCLTLANISKPKPLPRGLGCLRTLKSLTLSWLFNLSTLPESIGYLTQLSRLVIRHCPKLKKLPYSLRNLKSLKLEIKECPKLERSCKQPFGQDCKLNTMCL